MKFRRLFEPCKLATLELANRVALPPITTNCATEDGFVSDRMVSFYKERARGGAGLIIVEDCIVEAPRGKHAINDIYIDDDKYVPGLHRLAQAIEDHGSVAAIQLSHGGYKAGRLHDGSLLMTHGQMPVAPSAVPFSATGFVVPQELTIEEIQDIEDKFAESALRAKEAGFKVISLHCTHGYLIEQFMSPLSNKRQDAYGGDLDNRFRFLAEIIYKMKQKVGDDFPLMCRISGEEIEEGGITLDNARRFARKLEACGVHSISVCVGGSMPGMKPNYLGVPVAISPMRSPRGELVYLAAAIKDVLSIPVMTANRIITPELAEKILELEKADIIGIGRGLIADPEWPKKAREGREKEIRHCISCQGCMTGQPVSCALNPVAGREDELKISRAEKVKKVFVAGGGPAGLEAARVAALRGHDVHLYEKDTLGGQLNLACVPPGKQEIKLLVDFEIEQMKKLGVKVEHRELTPEIVGKEKPDAVIVATGSHPKEPEFDVHKHKNVIFAQQVLKGNVPEGKIIVIGGRQTGAETAEFLAAKGNRVAIVEASNEISKDTGHQVFAHYFLLFSLENLGVKTFTNATVEEVTETGVIIKQNGQSFTVEADAIVLAPGNKSDQTLAGQLKGSGIEMHVIGDCNGVGKIAKAIKEGFRAGLAV
jgi:2,4-dienoyl-CoA reductase-like NADH-dependent reductase (Old Yellow Enzyme family)/thioredoxin reductase